MIASILKGLSNIPDSFIKIVRENPEIVHAQTVEYSSQCQKNISKRIAEIDRMIANGYQRMLKNDNEAENELWNATYASLRAEKEELRHQQQCFDKADGSFYKNSNLIIHFCQNAHANFLKATPDEKRTICEIIGSNYIVNGKNIDITMYPIFYDIMEINQLGTSETTGFELTESQMGTKKEPSKKALNLNGGLDASRFELLEKYKTHLKDSTIYKIIYLIQTLKFVA